MEVDEVLGCVVWKPGEDCDALPVESVEPVEVVEDGSDDDADGEDCDDCGSEEDEDELVWANAGQAATASARAATQGFAGIDLSFMMAV